MNVHAHLFTNEIIGYNWGFVVNEEKHKHLFIQDSNICQSMEDIEADRTKTVEMEPESAKFAHEKAVSRGQSVIGWYHSHPQFDVNPSNIDVNNHMQNQQIFDNDKKPFVALIVGTYSHLIDTKGSFTSLLKWFHLPSAEGKK